MQPGGTGIGGREPGQRPVGLGQQRVAPRGGRQHALGRADDDDHVDVEPDRAGERPDRDTVADAPLAGGAGIEFGFERGAVLVARHRLTHGVEVAQAIERGGERLPGSILGLGKALDGVTPEPPLDLIVAPRATIRTTTASRRDDPTRSAGR